MERQVDVSRIHQQHQGVPVDQVTRTDPASGALPRLKQFATKGALIEHPMHDQ